MHRIDGIGPNGLHGPDKADKGASPVHRNNVRGFQEFLADRLQEKARLERTGVKFSVHASSRLASRNIEMDSDRLARLNRAVDQAEAKGSRETLVIMKDLAMIVNIKNRTVVTAMEGKDVKENVFTKIDSAIIS